MDHEYIIIFEKAYVIKVLTYMPDGLIRKR